MLLSLKKNISKKWGNTFLNQIEMELKTFDPKIKNMLKKETDLCNQYTKLTAGAKIDYNGSSFNLAGLGPFHKDKERVVRKSSFEARFSWFEENADILDRIYDDLVKLRHEIAYSLGYENFVPLGYLRMKRQDYGPDDVARFRKQIVDHVVPICAQMNEKKKEILGLENIYFYDGINFKDGDPKPKGSPVQLIAEA